MGLLPLDIDILPPSDDRVFKLILTSPDAKPALSDFLLLYRFPKAQGVCKSLLHAPRRG